MPLQDDNYWSTQVRRVLQLYPEILLRKVAGQIIKARRTFNVEELIDSMVSTLANAAVIDRSLKALSPGSRQLLNCIGRSCRNRWRLANLLELLPALEQPSGIDPLLALFDEGLLYPDLGEQQAFLSSFEQWIEHGTNNSVTAFVPTQVTARVLLERLELPTCPGISSVRGPVYEADGLEWPLRLAVAWQQLQSEPLRLTQQGAFFKRDFERLEADPLLSAPPAESVMKLKDQGLLAIELAKTQGLIIQANGQLQAGSLPSCWELGILETLKSLWIGVLELERWNAADGWKDAPASQNPFPSAYLLAMLLLGSLPPDSWADVAVLTDWIGHCHPFWSSTSYPHNSGPKGTQNLNPLSGLNGFLLGLAFELRLVQTAKNAENNWVVRLTSLGQWLLGLVPAPPISTDFSRTLLVQPNFEIIVYRQGLTPGLVAALSHFGEWKSLGSACTLQLTPETIYRALESGWTFETILQKLDQHGMRPTPDSVRDSLRTWADKRERLTVYQSAALLEFPSAADLEQALARGLPGLRLSDRLAVVSDENAIDYRNFRLIGTRDYGLPPDQCVSVGEDGVTLTVDSARADLLLETELQRFAELKVRLNEKNQRQYRITPASIAAGRNAGFDLAFLEDWFLQRTGRSLTPALRLFFVGGETSALELRHELVLHVDDPELADGLVQWPATGSLIGARLGPTTLAIADDNVERLRKELAELGLTIQTWPNLGD